jgi:phosphate transport system substrate-binding protein
MKEDDVRGVKKYATAAIAAVVLAGVWVVEGCKSEGQGGAKQAVTVKGSDTMVHLASAWAEAFMKKNPQAEVAVTGGGSGTGIAALLNGTTDVCTASRKIEARELQQAAARKIDPKEFVVALDGIAIVVNPANPLNEIGIEQLKKIYVGTYANWKDVGGPDEAIVLLSRESSSGTYVFFQERVLDKKDYARSARLMPATSAIIQEVSASKGAIGYVGLGYAAEAKSKVKVLKVKEKDGAAAIEPSVETVVSGKYPISRPLNVYTRGEPAGAVKAFVDFCLSPEGQQIVKETGFVPMK